MDHPRGQCGTVNDHPKLDGRNVRPREATEASKFQKVLNWYFLLSHVFEVLQTPDHVLCFLSKDFLYVLYRPYLFERSPPPWWRPVSVGPDPVSEATGNAGRSGWSLRGGPWPRCSGHFVTVPQFEADRPQAVLT